MRHAPVLMVIYGSLAACSFASPYQPGPSQRSLAVVGGPDGSLTTNPHAGKIALPYKIGYTASNSTAAADLESVESWLGRDLDMTAMTIVMSGWWYGGIPGRYAIDVSFPMLSIAGWDNLNATDLAVAAAGGYDGYYRNMAKTLADAGNPMIVRVGWEMNGNWYPWSIGNKDGRNNTAANYVATFRRIANILRANVPGVKIEFCTNWQDANYGYPNGTDAGTPLDYWPGAEYVDVVSMDIYQSNIGDWTQTQSGGRFDLDWLVAFAKTNHVHVALAEWGAGHGDPEYIRSAIAWFDSLGPLFLFSIYSSWEPADQLLRPGQSPAQQAVWLKAWGNTFFSP